MIVHGQETVSTMLTYRGPLEREVGNDRSNQILTGGTHWASLKHVSVVRGWHISDSLISFEEAAKSQMIDLTRGHIWRLADQLRSQLAVLGETTLKMFEQLLVAIVVNPSGSFHLRHSE
jgi:hypothetical protein